MRASRGTKYVRVVGKKNALFSGNQHFAHCLDLAFECVAIIIFTPFVEDRISSMATATHGEWYGDKRENTFLTTRCEASWKKKKVRNPRGVAEGKRVEERGASEKYAHEFVILLFSSFSFLSPSLSFSSSAASYSLIIAIQGGHGLLIVRPEDR